MNLKFLRGGFRIQKLISSKSLLFFLIILLGGILRLLFINVDLPYSFYGDENYLIYHALKFGTGDLNPHWFVWPQLFEYFLFSLYGIYFLSGKILGIFTNPYDFLYSYLKDPTYIFIISRTATAILGILTIIFLYKTLKLLFNEKIALLSSFLLAINPLHINYSHFSVTDVPMLFMMTLAFYFLVPVFKEDYRIKDLIKGGFILGLATGTKYPAVIFSVSVIFILISHWLMKRITFKYFLSYGVVFGVFIFLGFFMASPYCVLDFSKFRADILDLGRCSKVGWFGWEDVNAFIYHFKVNLREALGLPLLAFSLLALFYCLFDYKYRMIPFITFLGVYYSIFGSSRTYYDRFMLPVVFFLLIFSGVLLYQIRVYLYRFTKKYIRNSFLFMLFALLCLQPLKKSIYLLYGMSLPDTRVIAKEWIEENIPQGAKILLDPYGPPLNQSPYNILNTLKRKTVKYPYQKRRAIFYHLKAKKSRESKWYNIFFILHPIGYMEGKKDYEQCIERTMDSLKNYKDFDYVILTSVQWDKYFLKGTEPKYYTYRVFYKKFAKIKPVKKFLVRRGRNKGPDIYIYKIQR